MGGGSTGGGSTGGGGTGAEGGGSAGGAGGGEPDPCATPSGPSGPPVFFTTLDDLGSLQLPVYGAGNQAAVVTTPANDFPTGACGHALRIDGANEYARVQNHVDEQRGTLLFWYASAVSANGGDRHLFSSTEASGANRLLVEIRPVAGLTVELHDSMDAKHITIAGGVAALDSGNWVHVRIVWNVALSGQMVRVWFDGVEATYGIIEDGPITVTPATGARMVIGARDAADSSPAKGLIDELAIFDYAVPP